MLHEQLDKLIAQHGVLALHRALNLAPMVSSLRDDAQYHLDSATGAAQYEGVMGSLVLGVPRKQNQPTECTWVGGKVELVVRV